MAKIHVPVPQGRSSLLFYKSPYRSVLYTPLSISEYSVAAEPPEFTWNIQGWLYTSESNSFPNGSATRNGWLRITDLLALNGQNTQGYQAYCTKQKPISLFMDIGFEILFFTKCVSVLSSYFMECNPLFWAVC